MGAHLREAALRAVLGANQGAAQQVVVANAAQEGARQQVPA